MTATETARQYYLRCANCEGHNFAVVKEPDRGVPVRYECSRCGRTSVERGSWV